MNKSALRKALFKALDILPGKIGFALYHAIQQRFTASFETKLEANNRTSDKLISLTEMNAIKLKGRKLLEIGSGWMPLMPYLLKQKSGVAKVYTYDINDHYQNKYIDELNTYFADNGLRLETSQKGLHLPDFVEYHPNSNVISARLPEQVDLIFSRFVLEHVTPEDIVDMHERFAELYPADTAIMHFISPSDHRAFSDSSLSHYDFLRYSEREWNSIQTKFDYHNRLRLPDYLRLFDQSGMEVVFIEHDQAKPGTKKYDQFKKVPIHDDFKKYSDEELTAGSINVLLRRKQE